MSTTPNAALAWRVMDQIDAYPDLWDQGSWIGEKDCGTVACFAGWAVLLSGCRVDTRSAFDKIVAGPDELIGKAIPRAADILLGINVEYLKDRGLPDPYDGLHTRTTLGEAVEQVFGPRPEVPEHAPACAYPLPHPSHTFQLPDEEKDGEFGPERQCEGVAEDADVPPNAGSAS